MFGKLNETAIEQLLANQLIGRIGCHADGSTYIVPISYAYDGTYVYARTFEGRKMEMMRKNPKLCFQVDDTRDLSNWQSAVCWGDFEELKTEEQFAEAIRVLNSRALPMVNSQTMHISSMWPFAAEVGEKVPGILFRIRLTEKTGRFERSREDFFYAT